MVILVADRGRGSRRRRRASDRSWLRIALSAWGTDILHERSYVWLVVSRLCYLALPAVISGYAVFVLERSFGMAPDQAAPYLIVIGLIIALATVAGDACPRRSSRIAYGRKRVIYWSYALAAVGLAGFAVAPTLPADPAGADAASACRPERSSSSTGRC